MDLLSAECSIYAKCWQYSVCFTYTQPTIRIMKNWWICLASLDAVEGNLKLA